MSGSKNKIDITDCTRVIAGHTRPLVKGALNYLVELKPETKLQIDIAKKTKPIETRHIHEVLVLSLICATPVEKWPDTEGSQRRERPGKHGAAIRIHPPL